MKRKLWGSILVFAYLSILPGGQAATSISIEGLTETELRQVWNELNHSIDRVNRLSDYYQKAQKCQEAQKQSSINDLDIEEGTGAICTMLAAASLGLGGTLAAGSLLVAGSSAQTGAYLWGALGTITTAPPLGFIAQDLLTDGDRIRNRQLFPAVTLNPQNFAPTLQSLGDAHKLPKEWIERRDEKLEGFRKYIDERLACEGYTCVRNMLFNKMQIQKAAAELARDDFLMEWYRSAANELNSRKGMLLEVRKAMSEALRIADSDFELLEAPTEDMAGSIEIRSRCVTLDLVPLQSREQDLLVGMDSPVPTELCIDRLFVRPQLNSVSVEGQIFGTVPGRERVLFAVPATQLDRQSHKPNKYPVTIGRFEESTNSSDIQTKIVLVIQSDGRSANVSGAYVSRTNVPKSRTSPAHYGTATAYYR